MKLEILIFGGIALYLYNYWHNGWLVKYVAGYKKHYQCISVVLGALFLYRTLKQNSADTRKIVETATRILQIMPAKKLPGLGLGFGLPVRDFKTTQQQYRMYGSGLYAPSSGKIKRAVSETKKKYVASQQGWLCGNCQNRLTHTFEVDHIQRLDKGGSNDPSNLVALCRECHGQKTALENM